MGGGREQRVGLEVGEDQAQHAQPFVVLAETGGDEHHQIDHEGCGQDDVASIHQHLLGRRHAGDALLLDLEQTHPEAVLGECPVAFVIDQRAQGGLSEGGVETSLQVSVELVDQELQ